MGNRAVITASKSKTAGIGIYVHWNGGPESVLAFLDECRARGYRDPGADESYAMARLCGLICEFFGGGDSVGLGPLRELDCDNYDNGVYVIGEDWKVTARWGKGSTAMPAVLDKRQALAYTEIRQALQEGAAARAAAGAAA